MECQPALHYHSPTAAERETKSVTVERSAELSDEYSAVDAESQIRKLQSLRRATSLYISVHVDSEVADNSNWHDLVSAHSDW